MSRKPTLDTAIVRKLRQKFESFGINEHYFRYDFFVSIPLDGCLMDFFLVTQQCDRSLLLSMAGVRRDETKRS